MLHSYRNIEVVEQVEGCGYGSKTIPGDGSGGTEEGGTHESGWRRKVTGQAEGCAAVAKGPELGAFIKQLAFCGAGVQIYIVA